MSKKNFIDGLESIFAEDVLEQAFQDESPLFSYEARSSREYESSGSASSSTIEDEDFDEYEGPLKPNQILKRHRKPLSGIDLLIRNTTEEGSDNPKLHTRKFSLQFDKTVFNKLKAIARLEKVYFRDMVAHVLESFVTKYEEDKGPIE